MAHHLSRSQHEDGQDALDWQIREARAQMRYQAKGYSWVQARDLARQEIQEQRAAQQAAEDSVRLQRKHAWLRGPA
ncbi:hypothetical protein LAJ19_20270 (plasmid) [Deinococcus taeanensis]|uniref:hypothetical protein n=1 Tax=Deinococcus taeanensis TaxID=2737050 RepID=UPI001CDB4C53|nr:hypothetical protein [Deinococcus taeanensis]UBV45463.1 hypothetical protein LAJ19_20270 [Deinococcus taeanensis]